MSQRYELKGKIGEGGIGTVHRAFDTQLKRDVAIKRLIPVDGGNSAAATENLSRRPPPCPRSSTLTSSPSTMLAPTSREGSS